MPTEATGDDRSSAERYIVRHGAMRALGEFTATPDLILRRLDRVAIKSDRGLELGDILCPSTPAAIANIPEPTFGTILRHATPSDREREIANREVQKKHFEKGQELVAQHQLAMQLIDVELLLGGERLVFFFLAEKRIDFRELVKSMAREFQTRIELRQVGIRDEAKLLADYGDCGKPVCCNTHMLAMPPVSMRMAKVQKSTLDPSKISGRCGRLKCCLRFEQDVYEEFLKELPNVGTRVVTKSGQGRVLAQEILARRVLIEYEDGRRLPVAVAEILTRL